ADGRRLRRGRVCAGGRAARAGGDVWRDRADRQRGFRGTLRAPACRVRAARRSRAMRPASVPLATIIFVFTYPSRAVGLLAPAIDRLPRQVLAYLQLVGPAVLAALAAVDIMVGVENGESYFTIGLPWLSVGACIALVWWRKNLFLGLAAAIAIAIGGRALGFAWAPTSSGGPRPRSRRASSARSAPRPGR